MESHETPTNQELWALVRQQQAEIEQLKARRGFGLPAQGIKRGVSVLLSMILIVVTGGVSYGALPASRHQTLHSMLRTTQPGWYVRWNGTRWVSSHIQLSDRPFERTVIVSPVLNSDGSINATASGTALLSALAFISSVEV